MPATLDPATALVLIDLQHGITALPTAHPSEQIVARCARLADAGGYRVASMDSSRMSRPLARSSSLMVRGGATRKMLAPAPGSCTMFMCRPRSRQFAVTLAPRSGAGCLVAL